MSFIVDKQTLEDLNLLGKYKSKSIFNVFSKTHTRGGERVLERMFREPLSDAEAINKRSGIIRYFQQEEIAFPFEKSFFESVETYLSSASDLNPVVAFGGICRKKFFGRIAAESEFDAICSGLVDTVEFLNILSGFNTNLLERHFSPVYAEVLKETSKILEDKRLIWARKERGRKCFPLQLVAKYDRLLRAVCMDEMQRLMEIIYEMDVYMTAAAVAKARDYGYALAMPMAKGKNLIHAVNVFHPQLHGAKPNTVDIDYEHNVIFLTGANMAGKSTYMKAFAISVYLAHMGFPVAAEKMEFSVHDGMFTSINVSDNLSLGYSHFYAEVLRVKRVAEEVSQGKNLIIIFDELFKGTNVKDAYDATLTVSEAFAENRNCSYIISTHIIEAGQALADKCDNFKFVYLPTIMKGKIPTYTYKAEEGISNDRHGMMIIDNEHIVDIIKA